MTKHQTRQQELRERIKRVVKHLDKPDGWGRGKADGYTTFAERMAKIASDKNITISRQVNRLVGGVPKDLPTSVRAFANGRVGMTSARLDVLESTCIELEHEHREARRVARIAEASGVPYTGVAHDGVQTIRMSEEAAQGATELSVDFTVAAFVDPEIVVVAEVYEALKKLPTDKARNRVAHYAIDRLASEDRLVIE